MGFMGLWGVVKAGLDWTGREAFVFYSTFVLYCIVFCICPSIPSIPPSPPHYPHLAKALRCLCVDEQTNIYILLLPSLPNSFNYIFFYQYSKTLLFAYFLTINSMFLFLFLSFFPRLWLILQNCTPV